MRALFDNYEMDASINEQVTDQETKEENDFITALLKTDVMKTLMKFFYEKGSNFYSISLVFNHIRRLNSIYFVWSTGAVGNTFSSQFSLLRTLWFSVYTRGGGVRGSSGFEHVFLHEIKNNEVSGLHNWIYYHDLEQAKNHPIDFLGVTKQLNLDNVILFSMFLFFLIH